MRFFKLALFTILVIFTIIAITFFARNSIVKYFSHHYLAEYNGEISCLNFTLNLSLGIDIKKLCITSPQARFELENTVLDWQLFPQISVTAIKVANIKIQGNTELFFNKPQINNVKHQQSLSSDDFSVALQHIAQFNLSTLIDVEQFTYQPFKIQPLSTQAFIKGKLARPQTSYTGQFSVNKETLNLTLKHNQQHLLSVTLVPTGSNFSAELKADLALLREFLADHKLNLPTQINEDFDIKGTFNSQIEWKNQALFIDGKLDELSISAVDLKQSDQLQLKGSLAWQMRVIDQMINIDFLKDNKIDLTYSEARLIELFTELLTDQSKKQSSTQKISTKTTLAAILKDNPTHGITLSAHNNMEINLADSSISIAELRIKTHNINQASKLSLTELFFNFSDKEISVQGANNKVKFAIESHLNIAALNSFTKQPIFFKAEGDINQDQQNWLVHLTPESKVELTKVELSKVELSNAKKLKIDKREDKVTTVKLATPPVNNDKNILSINKLVTQLQGNIKATQNGILTLALTMNSQAHTLSLNEIIQIDKLQINADIQGNFTDVKVKANIIADDVEISKVIIKGDITQPQFELSAEQLLLTDLLALKINLPVPVKLIDGELNYHLSGLLSELRDLKNNTVELSVALTRISGEIDNVWLQDINWQQQFSLSHGQINTLESEKNNLNIKLIETASPITNLSVKTHLNIDLHTNSTQLNFAAKHISGEILGGGFAIPSASWPFNAEHSVNVQLTNIDLEKVLELDKKQGIVVTGNISGHLPLYFNGKNIMIKKGELHNINNGLIQIINNPAVEELKASNSQLKLAFGALQNLHYHQLSSDVSMNDDGYMLLETVIKGRNPDLDNDVNLNLNLSYDLLGLLESMTITERFEERIIKDLQKH
ncbi:MAG: hypothetical protein ACI9LM_001542 [Alteromonadaceae bacterium]